jgi:hypothetical protein
VSQCDSAPRGATEGRHVRWRRWRRAFAAVLLVVIVSALVTARLLVWPAHGMPTRVSAIAMLAGPGNRLPVALTLAREHGAPVLVVSGGSNGYMMEGCFGGSTYVVTAPLPLSTLALPDRLRMGGTAQGTGGLPRLLNRPPCTPD